MTNKTTPRVHPLLLNFVRPSAHSKFSPSAGERWSVNGCSFSVNFCKDIPEQSSVYAIEGSYGHAVCEARFREVYFMIDFPESLKSEILLWEMGDQKRSGAFQEMLYYADQYVEVVGHWLRNEMDIGDVLHYGVEAGIPIFPEEGCFGTADFLIVGTKGAVIIDYKYGKGKSVNADSLQLRIYAAGVFRHLEELPEGYLFHSVIHQPRTDLAPKEHTYTSAEIKNCLDEIWVSIQASKRPDLQPVEGSHCFWCPARRTMDSKLKCPAIEAKTIRLAETNFQGFLDDMNAPIAKVGAPNLKRDEALIKIMGLTPLMIEISKNAKEEFEMRLGKGEKIDGVSMVEEVGPRTYNAGKPEEIAALLSANFPKVQPYKIIPETKKIKTITEVEKEIGKNKLDSICVRKVTKKVDILDDKMRTILKDMAAFGAMINNGQGQED